MDKIRIGVVGLGFGQHHVRTLANLDAYEVVAVADRVPDLPDGLAAYAKHYGATPYEDAIEMMEAEKLDAVSICTSPRWRKPIIEAAIAQDLALIIEKPWASNVAHAEELAALCRTSNAPVMAAFSFRYHPAIVRLRGLLDDELGSPWLLNGEYLFSWAPPSDSWLWDPENGNGYINENSCHLFDAVCYLLGEPETVMATANSHLGAPSENAAAITIRFENGASAALTVGGIGTGAFRTYPRIDLVAANGQAHLAGHEHIWTELTWATRDDESVQSIYRSPEGLGNTRYSDAFRHFADCIRNGRAPSSGVDDGVRSVRMAMAVYESARSGQIVEM